MEGASKIYTVLAAFGENHSRLLLDTIFEGGPNKDRVLQLIQILLESTGTPGRYPVDERCSHLAFSFWYLAHYVNHSYIIDIDHFDLINERITRHFLFSSRQVHPSR